MPLDGDHFGMVRFASKTDDYIIISGRIRRIMGTIIAEGATSSDVPYISQNYLIRPPINHFLMPFKRNTDFTGRDEEFNALHKIFADSKYSNCCVSLVGVGGVGKTQIAVEFAYQSRDLYQDIIWIDGSSQSALLSSFADVAREITYMEYETATSRPGDIASRVVQWLGTRSKLLLVIDDVDEATCNHVLLGVSGHILLTSRHLLID